jgi:hypothetical protein
VGGTGYDGADDGDRQRGQTTTDEGSQDGARPPEAWMSDMESFATGVPLRE